MTEQDKCPKCGDRSADEWWTRLLKEKDAFIAALRAENERLRRDLAHEQCERERLAKQLGASRDARQVAERERDRLREAAKAVYKHMLDSPLAHVPDSIFVPLEETLMDLDTPTPEDDQ